MREKKQLSKHEVYNIAQQKQMAALQYMLLKPALL
jgi:hypothetical protein